MELPVIRMKAKNVIPVLALVAAIAAIVVL
jgi:hypothetical protein